MNVTPSQREFAQAHQTRLDTFWPAPKKSQPTIQEWFDRAWQILEGKQSRYSIREIQGHVCRRFRVPHIYMESARRSHDHYLPRAVAIYFCHRLTGKSMHVIARHFGNRDHTTILHNVRAVEKMVSLGHPISKDVKALTKQLGDSHD